MCKRLCKANPAAPQLTHDTPFTTDRLPLPKLNVDGSSPFTRFFPNRFEALGYPPSPRPPSAILDANEASGETHMAAMQNAAPVMDAAFVISIKTRHDRTERQSPDQHAANRDASWFFFSVIGLSFFETPVSKSWLNSFSQQRE